MAPATRKFQLIALVALICWLMFFVGCSACDVERRQSDAELGLTPQQASGRHIYDQNCGRCHDAYSSHKRKGPSLQGIFKKQYLSVSGMPANDVRVGEIVRLGRNNMQGFRDVLTDDQVNDLLAYLHTL